jgi:hypothetical protein
MSRHSSTFSFDAPPRLGVALWGGLLLGLLLALTAELYLRSHGYEPSVTDDELAFCLQLDRADTDNAVVLVGSSRLKAGFDPEVFERRTGGRPLVNLTLAGLCPVAMLHHLARDDQFKGTVLFSSSEQCFERKLWRHQQGKIDFCERASVTNKLNRALELPFEAHIALFNHGMGLDELLRFWLENGSLRYPPRNQYDVNLLNSIDYSETGPTRSRWRAKRLANYLKRNPPSPPGKWVADALRVDHEASMIQRRGGKVIMLRYPTTGAHWTLDERAYPRRKYWDAFAKKAKAATVHFRDIAGVERFQCGDGSHLDFRDKAAFTELLLDHLQKRKLLEDTAGRLQSDGQPPDRTPAQ